ncbi:hypothetical protein DRN86_00870, partial [Candidatus Geothermarchaeota archaeon]
VTKRILNELRRVGLNISEITTRLRIETIASRQMSVHSKDLKRKIEEKARDIGLIVFPSACCANAYNSSVPCASICYIKGKCLKCPNSCPEKLPKISTEDVFDAVAYFTGRIPNKVEVSDDTVMIKMKLRNVKIIRALETVLRRKVLITK